ncbi:hypothetical protein ACPOL_1867 [Acidisarcina polymorpha]|uniref:Uncharacterized protein n=1 Tax=Acidisarcina polymorpha TaxID=2211140 RepID=A0A2Z5FXL0_9BACT|nr:hypothetical protein ACPOL_1867 [Acidisarcina polymorpha]
MGLFTGFSVNPRSYPPDLKRASRGLHKVGLTDAVPCLFGQNYFAEERS